jgi:hypothetical protein
MATYGPVFNTIYEKPILTPPKVDYGQSIVFLGLASAGPLNNLTYVPNLTEAKKAFVSGPLIDACEEAFAAEAETIYLVRLEDISISSLNKVREVLLDYDLHIIVLIGGYFDDVEDYPQWLVDLCSAKKNYGETVSLIGIKPFESDVELTTSMVDAKVTELYQNQKARAGFEEGYFLSVVFSELLLFQGSDNARYSAGLPTYAAVLSRILPGSSPVNKKVKSEPSLRYSLTRSTRVENIDLDGDTPTQLQRKPFEGTVRVVSSTSTPIEYSENIEYTVDYNLGTIVGKQFSGPVIVTYKYDDIDSLGSVGFVTMTNFVKNGVAYATSTTMSKNTIALIQDIRVMQAISSHIREAGMEQLIGNLNNVNLDAFNRYIESYISYMITTDQIVSGNHEILRTGNGRDISVDVDVLPRDAVRVQTFRVRLPLPG